MLLTEYLPEHGVYIVIPVINGRPDPLREFVFAHEAEQLAFIVAWWQNPIAAVFAYNAHQEMIWAGENLCYGD